MIEMDEFIASLNNVPIPTIGLIHRPYPRLSTSHSGGSRS